MSGQLVMTVHGDNRSFYMVNLRDAKEACGEVNRLTGTNEAHALAPVTAEILDHYEVRHSRAWLSQRPALDRRGRLQQAG